jgi:Domain of unknown function (DUF4126)
MADASLMQIAADGVTRLDTTQLLAIAAALGWASGLRLYAVVFLTGAAGAMGWVTLPPGLQMLQQPLLLGASGAMLALEFFADKLPWVDSLWDAVHTVIRIPAGAALAAGAFGLDGSAAAMLAALMGGTLAAAAHTGKAATRAAVNTSPEPFSNLALSLAGDAAVPMMLWLSWTHPLWFFAALALALGVSIGLGVLLFGFLRRLGQRLRDRFAPAASG